MSPQRKQQLGNIALALAPILAGALLWAARAFAYQAVDPVESRVTTLEAKREADAALLKEVRDDVKELLQRVPPRE